MRGHLRESFIDSEGDVQGGKALTFYERNGTTPLAVSIYKTATGSGTYGPSELVTNSDGEFEGWTNGLRRVQIAVTGRTAKVVTAFERDDTSIVFRVTDYGATGDGVTNDMLAIRATITALELAGRGGTLYFPTGSYRVGGADAGTEILLLSKSVVVAGNGYDSKLIVISSTPATTDIIRFHSSANEAADSGVRDLTITSESGAGSTVNYGRHAINIDITESGKFCRQFHINRLWMDGFAGRGIELTNPLPNANSFFTSSIRDSIISGGIRLINSGDSIIINGNTIYGSNVGVEAAQVPGATELIITDNNITSDGGGIWLKSGIKPVIERNIVERVGLLTGGSGNSALVDLAGVINVSAVLGASVKDNVITVANSALALDCLRLGVTDSAVVRDNVFSSATGRVAINITANTTTPDIGTNHDIGSGTMRRGTMSFPYGGTIASASTIAPPVGGGNLFIVSGTTTINTITPRGETDWVIFFPVAAWSLSTSGNIFSKSVDTVTIGSPIWLVYYADYGKWFEMFDRGPHDA